MNKGYLALLIGTFSLGFVAGRFYPDASHIPAVATPIGEHKHSAPAKNQDANHLAETNNSPQITAMAPTTQRAQTARAPEIPQQETLHTQTSPENVSEDLVQNQSKQDAENAIGNFQAFLQEAKNNNVSPINYAEQRFEQEAVNYDWSIEKEDQILASFEQQTALQDIVPLSVDCKSASCKVVVAVTDAAQANQLSGEFSRALTEQNTAHGLSSVTYFIDEKSGELVFYMNDAAGKSLFEQ